MSGMRSVEKLASCWLHFSPHSHGRGTCGIKRLWENKMQARLTSTHGSYTLQCGVVKSGSFSEVSCGWPSRIDKAVSPETPPELWSIPHWFTSTLRLMKSIQVRLQSSPLVVNFGEFLLKLTSMCRPQTEPGEKLRHKGQKAKDTLVSFHNFC